LETGILTFFNTGTRLTWNKTIPQLRIADTGRDFRVEPCDDLGSRARRHGDPIIATAGTSGSALERLGGVTASACSLLSLTNSKI
jgi:hypothetical protein